MPRKTEVVGGEELDDGASDEEGELYQWAWNAFGVEVTKIYSLSVDNQSEDCSQYLIEQISKAINSMVPKQISV